MSEESITDYLISGTHGVCITDAGLDRIWPREDDVEPLADVGKGFYVPPTCSAGAKTFEDEYGREKMLEYVFGGPPLPRPPDNTIPAVPLGDTGAYLAGAILAAFLWLKYHPKAQTET